MSNDDHIPQTSADPFAYEDARGIRIADPDWTCPECGPHGQLMHRPGSKNTCATCFWVRDGQYNDHTLADWPLTYRQGQALLAAQGAFWGGTPGDVGTELRAHYDPQNPASALHALQDLREQRPYSPHATPEVRLPDEWQTTTYADATVEQTILMETSLGVDDPFIELHAAEGTTDEMAALCCSRCGDPVVLAVEGAALTGGACGCDEQPAGWRADPEDG